MYNCLTTNFLVVDILFSFILRRDKPMGNLEMLSDLNKIETTIIRSQKNC